MRITILLVMFGVSTAFGQTSRGSFMVGGGIDFERTKRPAPQQGAPIILDNPTKSFSVSPKIGYFILDNWAAGLSPELTLASNDEYEGLDPKQRTYRVGVFTRYYFRYKKFAAFPDLSVDWGKSILTYHISQFFQSYGLSETQKYESEEWRYRGGVGLAYFLAPNVSLEGVVSYIKTDGQTYSGVDTWKKVVALNFGLQFFIPSNSKLSSKDSKKKLNQTRVESSPR